MTKGDLIAIIVNALPNPQLMRDIDLDSESDAIRFTWEGHTFRITTDLHIDQVEGNILATSTTITILMEKLLKTYRNTGI